MHRYLLVLILAGCASSSAPVLVEHEETLLLPLDDSVYPDGPRESRITNLIARGDHAVVLGMGACVGKAIDRCLAGAPVLVRADQAPRQLSGLRSPSSLLWPELREDGEVIVHRLPEGGEATLTRIQDEARRLDVEVDSSPGLYRSVDGGVIATVRRGEVRGFLHLGVDGEVDLMDSPGANIDSDDELTYVHGFDDGEQSLLTIGRDGAVETWFERATAVRQLQGPQHRVYCIEEGGTFFVEPATGVRLATSGACYDARLTEEIAYNDQEIFAWGSDPRRIASSVTGHPQVSETPNGWVVLDDQSVRWIDQDGYEVRREPHEFRGRMFVENEQVRVLWDDGEGSSYVRHYDGEVRDVFVGGFAQHAWAFEGVMWLAVATEYDEYLPFPATQLYRLESDEPVLELEAESLNLHDGLLSTGTELIGLSDRWAVLAEGSHPRHIAKGLYEVQRGSEFILVRWDGELTELATASERFEVRGTQIRWQNSGQWSIGRLTDTLELAFSDLVDARWFHDSVALVTHDDRSELCAIPSGSAARCWELPDGALVNHAVLTETDRMFAILRQADDNVLWYSRME